MDIPWPGEAAWYTFNCVCGQEVTLDFNGGELDMIHCPNCKRRIELMSYGYFIRIAD